MASLVFGVLDVAYSDAHSGGMSPADQAKTTGEVAEILEENYHVMQTFYDLRKSVIAEYLAEGMAQELQSLFRGKSKVKTILGGQMYGSMQRIETEFRRFLDANEMQKLAIALTGMPLSAAAARGVNHRKKHPYAKKNKPRPAFVDTGLYRISFRAWIKLHA